MSIVEMNCWLVWELVWNPLSPVSVLCLVRGQNQYLLSNGNKRIENRIGMIIICVNIGRNMCVCFTTVEGIVKSIKMEIANKHWAALFYSPGSLQAKEMSELRGLDTLTKWRLQ